MTPEQFAQAAAKQQIQLTPVQLQQFQTYYQYLVEENKKINLTAITEEGEVYLKHFYDSLTLVQALPALLTEPLSLCDVGAGAGFPSLPVKIAAPQLNVSIVDSLNKRIDFLSRLTAKLNLKQVSLYHDRAETFGSKKSQHRQSYDVVCARAVAPLNVLAELCLPLVKVGGHFIAMKGSRGEAEMKDAKSAIRQLGGGKVQEVALTLPEGGDERVLVVVTKASPTPKQFPRKPGTPSRQPLI